MGLRRARGWEESVLSPIWTNSPPLVRAGKVEVVLALNLNELGHSVSPLVQVLRAFVTHDVALIVPSRGIDTSCVPGKVISGHASASCGEGGARNDLPCREPMVLLQRKFRAIYSQTHSPALLACKAARMHSVLKAALLVSFPNCATCCGPFLKRAGAAMQEHEERKCVSSDSR